MALLVGGNRTVALYRPRLVIDRPGWKWPPVTDRNGIDHPEPIASLFFSFLSVGVFLGYGMVLKAAVPKFAPYVWGLGAVV